MSDDRIIDFNELKNKVKDSDVDKFEKIKHFINMKNSHYLVNVRKKIKFSTI